MKLMTGLIVAVLLSVSAHAFDLVAPGQVPLNSDLARKQMFPDVVLTAGDVYSVKDPEHPELPYEVIVVSDKHDPHYNDGNNVCRDHYTEAVRDVKDPESVLAAYGETSHTGFELDHFISLEIGGTNCTRAGETVEAVKDSSGKIVIPAHLCKSGNLWPQGYNPSSTDEIPGARLKDQVEDELKRRVCVAGTMNIHDAQAAFIGQNPVTGETLVIDGQQIKNWYDFFYYGMYLKDKAKYAGWLKTDSNGEKDK